MGIAEFLAMQSELYLAWMWFIRWFLILLIVGGMGASVFLFFLQIVSTWLDR